MARHEFTTRAKPAPEPVEIVLDGETFVCRAQVPGSLLLEHVDRLSDGATAASELLRIWEDVFDDAEHARFRAYIDDPSNTVDVQDLGEMLQAVLGDLSGSRPTTSSSRSAPGRATTGATSPSATSGSPEATPVSTN